MAIDYKKSFEKLVGQIKLETEWCEEEFQKYENGFPKVPNVGADKETIANYNGEVKRWHYYRGQRFAYNSIKELAEKLEKGEFEFE